MTPAHIVVVGNFGRGNLGDDLLLETLLTELRLQAPEARVRVLAPGGTSLPTQTAVVPRPVPLRRPWISIPRLASAVLRSDVLLIGPGGMVNDLFTGLLPGLAAMATMVRKRGGRVGLLGVGVGPFRRPDSRRWLTRLVAASDVISVRDEASARQLPPHPRCHTGSDLAWMHQTPSPTGPRQGMVVSLRPWTWAGEPQLSVAAAAVSDFVGAHPGEPVDLLAMDQRLDPPVLERLRARLPPDAPVQVVSDACPADLGALFASRRRVLAMRYHAGLLAASAGCSLALIGYDPKVISLGERLAVPVWHPDRPREVRPVHVDARRVAEAREAAVVHRTALRKLVG